MHSSNRHSLPQRRHVHVFSKKKRSRNSHRNLHLLTHTDPLEERFPLFGGKQSYEAYTPEGSQGGLLKKTRAVSGIPTHTSAAGEGSGVAPRTRKRTTEKAPAACKAIRLGARANGTQPQQLRAICGIYGRRSQERLKGKTPRESDGEEKRKGVLAAIRNAAGRTLLVRRVCPVAASQHGHTHVQRSFIGSQCRTRLTAFPR